jgi:hypothetical protein
MHRWRWKHCFVGGVLLTCTFFSWWMPFHMANLIQRFQPTVHIFGQHEQQSSQQQDEPQQNGENTTKTCAWNGRTWKCRQCRVKNGQRVQCRRLKRRRDAATATAGGRHSSCSHPSSNGPRQQAEPPSPPVRQRGPDFEHTEQQVRLSSPADLSGGKLLGLVALSTRYAVGC